MKQSLIELEKALIGEIGFTSSIEILSNSLFNGEIPSLWKRYNPPTEKSLGSLILYFYLQHIIIISKRNCNL